MATNETNKTTNRSMLPQTDVLGAMREEMDRLLERFETGWPRLQLPLGRDSVAGMRPDIDVHDDGQTFTVEADLPGMQEKDVEVTFVDGLLTIKGERRSDREEKKGSYYLTERTHGAFARTIRVPQGVDESKLEAQFADGVLKITAPRLPEAVKAQKRIEIKKA